MLKRLSLVLSSLLLLQACSSVPGVIEQPKVSIQQIQVQDISLTQGTAVIILNVSNPNAFPIPLQGIEYGLALNGRVVASGDQPENITIGARQDVPVKIPVTLDFAEILRLTPEMIRSRTVAYDLGGAVRLPFVKIPFQRQGGVGVRR